MSDIDTIIANVAGHDKTATRGPWYAYTRYVSEWKSNGHAPGPDDSSEPLACCADDADAALIAYYRTAAPALAQEVDRLRAELETARAALECIRDTRDNHDAHGCETCCLHDCDVTMALDAAKGAEHD